MAVTNAIGWTGAKEAATDPAGPTGRLCAWLAELRLEDIPETTREHAKDVLLDGLGCALVGAKLPWSQTAVNAATRFEGKGDRTLIGWGMTVPATTAALLNGTFIQGFELDDVHWRAPLHNASLVLPALLACSEELGGVSGADFLLAALAGFEVGPRVGLSLHGPEMLSRGWHSGAVFGTHSAAAAAGVLLSLDAARFEDAFGLAGTQSAGLMAAQFEAMCKRMHHGFSSRNGLFAALMAAGGYTGIKRVFEREYGGFLSVFGEGHNPLPDEISKNLGTAWETDRIMMKPYAAMGALHGPLDGIFEIMARRKAEGRALLADEIASVDIELSHAGYHHGWWVLERPLTPIGAQMNVGYAVAVAILDGQAMVHQFSPERVNADDVWALIPRIKAHHNLKFDVDKTTEPNMQMTVLLKDGTRLEQFIALTKSVTEPMTRQRTIAKFRTLTDGLVDAARQAAIVDTVARLESLESMQTLSALLAPPVGASF